MGKRQLPATRRCGSPPISPGDGRHDRRWVWRSGGAPRRPLQPVKGCPTAFGSELLIAVLFAQLPARIAAKDKLRYLAEPDDLADLHNRRAPLARLGSISCTPSGGLILSTARRGRQ